ncbi:ATP-binding cassette domain-containing protein [Paenibacillus tepidiphilus]|uniref:ATP-binding cassette domain-containing protein n=1 Tax=Paenibacillus tepidiphilus TaxID=2608683 RepID=UPI0012394298|nr:ATP-binding cassette domain-containing protein [Paenibacillus tepidiphilus]
MPDTLVELNHITKRYADKLVLSSVSLTIRRGETLMLLGGNGSGKSTLIKLIGGFIAPTTGSRKVSDSQPPRISFMPDRFPKHKFTSQEYLMHMGRIQGLPKAALQERIKELHDLLQLPLGHQPMQSFSKGMLQKVNLMQAVLSTPDLLLLDEPLSGLDGLSMQELAGALRELKSRHVTIVISTHETEMLQDITDRVITVQNTALIETVKQIPAALEPSVLVLCRLPAGQRNAGILSHPAIMSASAEESLVRIYARTESCDQLLLQILQSGGSVIEVTGRREYA